MKSRPILARQSEKAVQTYEEYLEELAELSRLEKLAEEASEGKDINKRCEAARSLYLELNGNHGDG